LDDLRAFPDEVKGMVGFALRLAQAGGKHPSAMPLEGFGGAGVLEIVADFDGSTYRAVYTVRLKHGVYALHAFQKKSTQGIKTSKRDIELIEQRLRAAEAEDRRRDTERRGAP
jgi:phage-related protein